MRLHTTGQMKIFKYYKQAVIVPSLFVLFFCIVYSFLDNYKSDPLPARSVIQTSIIPLLGFSLLVCGLSLTIFLSKIRRINQNTIWNILAWFLLPMVYISMVLIHDIGYRIKYGFGFGIDFLYLLIMTIPYVIGLCWTFINFRKDITATRL